MYQGALTIWMKASHHAVVAFIMMPKPATISKLGGEFNADEGGVYTVIFGA